MEDIMKIVRGVSETIQNELKKERISWLLGTLGASLLGNMLAGKGINRAGEGITRTLGWLAHFHICFSFDGK